MKTTRSHLTAGAVILTALVAVTAMLSQRQAVPTAAVANSESTRVQYLQERGYAVAEGWVELREVILPKDTEGEMAAYGGQRVHRYTYALAEDPTATVTLYVCRGRAIGLSPPHREQGETDGTTG